MSSRHSTSCRPKFDAGSQAIGYEDAAVSREDLAFGLHSVRSTKPAGVPAAIRAGAAATKLASMSVPIATSSTETGTVGLGTALMLRAKRIHSCRPTATPTGTPTTEAIALAHRDPAIALDGEYECSDFRSGAPKNAFVLLAILVYTSDYGRCRFSAKGSNMEH